MNTSRFDRWTRQFGRRTSRRTAVGAALAGLSLGGLDRVAAGQSTPAPGDDEDAPVFMFVQTFAAGRGESNPEAGTPVPAGTPAPGTPGPAGQATPTPGGGASFLLTLEGHTGQTIYFSDRPDRIVGALPTDDFLEGLGFTATNPPNAALVAEFRAGQGVVVLELIQPTYAPETGTVVYGAEVLDAYQGGNLEPVTREQLAERLPADFGPAALFIDDCPHYTSCLMELWASFGGEPVYVGLEAVGPIPNGPYKACFNKDGAICAPCDTTLEKLEVMCNTAYPDVCFGSCFPGS
jgi:hypothetical protein